MDLNGRLHRFDRFVATVKLRGRARTHCVRTFDICHLCVPRFFLDLKHRLVVAYKRRELLTVVSVIASRSRG